MRVLLMIPIPHEVNVSVAHICHLSHAHTYALAGITETDRRHTDTRVQDEKRRKIVIPVKRTHNMHEEIHRYVRIWLLDAFET